MIVTRCRGRTSPLRNRCRRLIAITPSLRTVGTFRDAFERSNSFIGASSWSTTITTPCHAPPIARQRRFRSGDVRPLHRVTIITNVLGVFTNTYLGGSALITTNLAPFGRRRFSAIFSITNDARLSEIWNQKANSVTLSKFDYGYDPVGSITNWQQQVTPTPQRCNSYGYDAGDQLLSAVLKSTGPGATVLKQFAYRYDFAGNRTSEQIDTGISQCAFNNLNQLTNRATGSGPMEFAGSVSRQATVDCRGERRHSEPRHDEFCGLRQRCWRHQCCPHYCH